MWTFTILCGKCKVAAVRRIRARRCMRWMVGHTLIALLRERNFLVRWIGRKGAQIWGKSVSGEEIHAPGGSRSPAVHPVTSHFPTSLWTAVICSTLENYVISGFHRGTNGVFARLGYYIALIGSYRRFGTNKLLRNVGSLLPINVA